MNPSYNEMNMSITIFSQQEEPIEVSQGDMCELIGGGVAIVGDINLNASL